MELLLGPAPNAAIAASFWRQPAAWLREKNLSRGFWVFFSAAFFFDAGFAIYFFLFNLYLLDYRFNERAMGWIGGAMTLGSLVGTLPAGALAQRIGLRPLLIVLFVTAPLLNAMRVVWIWEPAQIGLAFLAGLAMSSWGVCFLPGVARLTTEKNRTAAFSLIFSASVGTSMLGGLVCGYLPQWLRMAGFAMRAADVKRVILLASCAIVFLGLIPVLRLRIPSQAAPDVEANRAGWLSAWKLNPFLWRFLPLMALWSAVLAAFTPFANVYLSRELHIQITQIGLIFSTVQALQLFMGLVTPLVLRALGLVRGIAATQILAAVVLGLLAGTRNAPLAVGLYLTFAAAQWMSSPGLYNLLMNETPDAERSTAAAMTLFCNALAGSVATAGAGILLTRFGYPPVLFSIAIVALAIALLFRFLLKETR
jgi:predicted MFS family arabinose efflux permease